MSAIVCLDVNGKTEVVWAGDASMQTVSRVCQRRKPNVVVGPHHGGPIKRKQKSFGKCFDDPQPENVFVSVGTENIHDHPVRRFIELHRDKGQRVCCTELVHCDRRRRDNRDHVLNNHLQLGLLPPKENSAVTCRGPLQIRWDTAEYAFVSDRFHAIHQQLLSSITNAYCVA